MEIKKATFSKSSAKVGECPPPDRPEYAMIGRSNVGKSSLINMLTNQSKLAKTSGTPGKTQLINHFDIDDTWYLVDLPGYGYAKTAKSKRTLFSQMIRKYILTRENLVSLFVLIDIRHSPQENDMAFMHFLAEHAFPFGIIFTKSDKLRKHELENKIQDYIQHMLSDWEEMPPYFVSSAISKAGKEELLSYIDQWNNAETIKAMIK